MQKIHYQNRAAGEDPEGLQKYQPEPRSLPARPPFSISISFDFFTSSISYEITFCFYNITPYLGTLIFLKQVLYFLLKFFEFGYIDVDDCLAAVFYDDAIIVVCQQVSDFQHLHPFVSLNQVCLERFS